MKKKSDKTEKKRKSSMRDSQEKRSNMELIRRNAKASFSVEGKIMVREREINVKKR